MCISINGVLEAMQNGDEALARFDSIPEFQRETPAACRNARLIHVPTLRPFFARGASNATAVEASITLLCGPTACAKVESNADMVKDKL